MSDLLPIRVLIADDEPGMRMILRKMIARVDGYELVGEAADGAELMRLCVPKPQEKKQQNTMDMPTGKAMLSWMKKLYFRHALFPK